MAAKTITGTEIYRGIIAFFITVIAGISVKGCNDWDTIKTSVKVIESKQQEQDRRIGSNEKKTHELVKAVFLNSKHRIKTEEEDDSQEN